MDLVEIPCPSLRFTSTYRSHFDRRQELGLYINDILFGDVRRVCGSKDQLKDVISIDLY